MPMRPNALAKMQCYVQRQILNDNLTELTHIRDSCSNISHAFPKSYADTLSQRFFSGALYLVVIKIASYRDTSVLFA